jgi:hypothetical protein
MSGVLASLGTPDMPALRACIAHLRAGSLWLEIPGDARGESLIELA